jgi:DNA repair exonuclease SbcCD nuclease subunit
VRVLFVSDTHLGLDMPARPRVVRRRRGHDFFENFALALAPARGGEVDVVVHGGDLLYRSRVPVWLAEAALAPLREVAATGIPVLLVPGNHERGRLPFPLLAVQDGLHVFERPGTVVVDARGVRAAFVGVPFVRDIRTRVIGALATARRGSDGADVRVLCMHQAVEGATCGPGSFVFRTGADVVPVADLPQDVAVVLGGHVHRHQVLRPPGRPPVVYAGSVERTSFAEAAETKGYVVVELTRAGLGSIEFHPLPSRPMTIRRISFEDAEDGDALVRLASAIDSTPPDAVVQLRVHGGIPPIVTAAAIRALAGARNVTLGLERERPGG